MGHRLPSYKGLCASPHGHNMEVTVQVGAPEDYFLDFKTVSEHLHTILDDFDHAMILEVEDPFLVALEAFDFRVVTLNYEPTTENIAAFVFLELKRLIPGVCNVVSVYVKETEKYGAWCITEPRISVFRIEAEL